jgi:hypothetical protein
MGCDIHTFVEQQTPTGWEHLEIQEVFDWRSYHLFGWLAGVRNYSQVPPIAEPRGLPADVSREVEKESNDLDWHSRSWLSADELLAFDYDATFEDRRVTVSGDGGHTAEPGGGEMTTYREFLGPNYFADLTRLAELEKDAPTRVVFWFDN